MRYSELILQHQYSKNDLFCGPDTSLPPVPERITRVPHPLASMGNPTVQTPKAWKAKSLTELDGAGSLAQRECRIQGARDNGRMGHGEELNLPRHGPKRDLAPLWAIQVPVCPDDCQTLKCRLSDSTGHSLQRFLFLAFRRDCMPLDVVMMFGWTR